MELWHVVVGGGDDVMMLVRGHGALENCMSITTRDHSCQLLLVRKTVVRWQ